MRYFCFNSPCFSKTTALYRGQILSSSILISTELSTFKFSPTFSYSNFSPNIPATSRANPIIPKQSGRCVKDLFSISKILSLSPNMSARASPGCATSGSISAIVSCLSSKSSSSAPANIPLLSYLLSILRLPITNGASSLTLAGTTAPGAIHTASIPSRTFGAPHTTCTRPSASFSTLRASALPTFILHKTKCVSGIFSAFSTRTIYIRSYLCVSSITPSTSTNRAPISRTSSSSGTLISTYFFSQFSEIFMLKLPQKVKITTLKIPHIPQAIFQHH